MSRNIDLDKILDQAVDEIRDSGMPAAAETAALDRVWQRVRQEAESVASQSPENHSIRDCGDFQALIPAYTQGALNDAKKLLFEDHISECLPCRKSLKRARSSGRAIPAAAPAAPGWVSRIGWQAAAAAVVFLAVVGLSFNSEVLKIRAGGLVQIETIDGELLRVTDHGSMPVSAGEQFKLTRGESLRTTKGSRAMIRLADQSGMEMKERSQVAVLDESYFWDRADKDAVLELERGAVIIEASEQGSGNLFVETADSKVAVTGTVFSVNHGIKGTRVSVIEGEVHVDHNRNQDILLAGEQATTQPGLEKVDVATEIAWSQNLEKHLRLMREMTDLGRELDRVLNPERRYSTRLLDLTPDNTVVYIGIPNVSSAVAEAHGILLQKIDSSPVLREWWDANVVPDDGERQIEAMIQKITGYGEHLGDEIVVTLQMGEAEVQPPLVLAELSRPAATFKLFLEGELEDLRKSTGARDAFAVLEGERPDTSGIDADMFLWLHDDLLVAGERDAILRFAADTLTGRQATTSGLRDQLRDRYRGGVEWVVGVDMQTIIGQSAGTPGEHGELEQLERLGLLDMTYLVGERTTRGDHTDNRVVLSFGQARRGVAAWLDEPAPMGSLDFISPDASAAAAFVMQEPAAMVDDLFETLTSMNEDFRDDLARFEQENSISIRDDIAAALGGEFAFALDGPVLPTPSWKVVIEVYNPEQLQQTLGWAVGQVNTLATEAGKKGLAMHEQELGGRVFYQIESLDVGISAYYTFVDGYFLAGPSTAVLQRALQVRDSGATLPTSPNFTSLLSVDHRVNFSGVVYQNLGGLLEPLAQLSGAARNLSPDATRMANEIARNSRPSLTMVYGAPNEITFTYTHEGGFLTSGLSNFLSFKSLTGMRELVEQATKQ